ncbi:MAG: zinc-binding dehydrogenase [Anaerolineales bacterium]|jgi:threonine dehydrogenase-like Zn-dependent dehydrogenase
MRTIYVERTLPKMLAVKALQRVWPGVVWSPFSPACVADLPDPPLPGPRGVRLRNRVCGICATDLSLLNVQVDPAIGPAALPGNRLFYLGHEVVSDVVEVGAEASPLAPGQRVVMDGRLTGSTCRTLGIEPPCPFCANDQPNLCEHLGGVIGVGGGFSDGYTADARDVYPVPDDLSDDQAAMIEPMSIAVHAVLRCPPKPGDHVLVVGSGIIGLLTLQAVRAFAPGVHLTALARYPHQAEAARKCGAQEVITGGDLYLQMARVTGGQAYQAPLNRGMLMGGFEVIYDCVGTGSTLSDSLRWARAAGTVVMVGIDLSILRVDLNPIWYAEVNLVGSRTHGSSEFAGKKQHDYAWVIDLQRRHELWVDGLITHRFPLAQYQQAVRTWEQKGRNGAIKIVFDLRPEEDHFSSHPGPSPASP